MRVLVTGHRGNVGATVARQLTSRGHDVTGFDLADGDDLLDLARVKAAAVGCSAVVHLGAVAHDSLGRPEQIMAVNVLGTWHTLLAAEQAYQQAVLNLAQAQANRYADTAALFQALGGGWWNRNDLAIAAAAAG